MKHILLTLTFCSSFIICHAQRNTNAIDSSRTTITTPKNTIKIYAGDFAIKNTTHMGSPITMIGGYYERYITKQLYAGIGFAKWTSILNKNRQTQEVREVPNPALDPSRSNGLQTRRDLKMVDLYAYHKFHLRHTNHYFNLGGGLSYAWGIETHYDKSISQANPIAVASKEVLGKYWGFVPSFSYDYIFLSNLLNAGIDVRARFYRGYPKTQYDIGIHIGVNF